MPEVSAVDEDDIEEAIEASSVSASGVATVVSGVDIAKLNGLDIAVVNGATVCADVPAEVVKACATASDCAANPAGPVVGAGAVNGLGATQTCAAT